MKVASFYTKVEINALFNGTLPSLNAKKHKALLIYTLSSIVFHTSGNFSGFPMNFAYFLKVDSSAFFGTGLHS